MDRAEYIKKLEYLLQDISEEERKEAIEFYENYFDEAGEENEQKIIEELGEAEKVAAIIKAGLNGQFEENMSSGNDGFYNQDYQRNYEVIETKQERKNRLKEKWDTLGKRDRTILIVLFIIAILPISVGLFGGALGVSLSIVAVILGILLAPWLCAIALGVVGVASIVIGVIECFTHLGAGFIYIGIGCIIVSIAELFKKGASWLYKDVFIPGLNKFVDAFHKEGRAL